MTTIDHLVYGVHDLEAASDWFEQLSGIRPIFGGYHKTQGTKNALVGLGGRCYLEFIAIDPDNEAIKPPRWMGIDLLDKPKLIRWAAVATDLTTEAMSLAEQNPQLGRIIDGQRKISNGQTLKWRMSLPASEPAVEVLPFLLDWSDTPTHPAEGLKHHCQLEKLMVFHSEPTDFLDQMSRKVEKVKLVTGANAIKALLQTPNGLVWM